MKASELKQISNMVSKTIELYVSGAIEKDQINDIFHKFTWGGPNCWPSRVFDGLKDVEYVESNYDLLGKEWASIIDLFVSSPGYLINTFCKDNSIEFSPKLATSISIVISWAADEAIAVEKSGKEIVFEGI